MRHLIGRHQTGLSTQAGAGIARSRPRSRVVWGVAVSVLVHVALLATTWNLAPRKPSKEPTRLSVRLAAAAPAAKVVPSRPAATPTAAVRSADHKPARAAKLEQRELAAKAKLRARTAAAPAAAAVAQAAPAPTPLPTSTPAEPIDGSVFALPHVGLGGFGSPRWMKAPAAAPMPPPPSFIPPPAAHAQAARDASRAQIALALQQQVSAWRAPEDASDGSCALHAQRDDQLDCDNASLQRVVGAQAQSLAGLLAAYRSIEPSAGSLSILYREGRYRVSLASAPLAQ